MVLSQKGKGFCVEVRTTRERLLHMIKHANWRSVSPICSRVTPEPQVSAAGAVSVAAVTNGSTANTSSLTASTSDRVGQQRQSRPHLPNDAIGMMEYWFEQHEDNPHPTDENIEHFSSNGVLMPICLESHLLFAISHLT